MPITTLSIIGGIIVAFIGGIFSGGGVVEALKARRAAKAVDEKVSVEKFEATIRGFEKLLAAESDHVDRLTVRVTEVEVRQESSERYVDLLIEHINAGKPPPPPPRP